MNLLRARSACSLLLFLALAMSRPLFAQPSGTSDEKRIVAVKLIGDAPRLDGRLDEESWRRATFVSDFLQKEPHEGTLPTERTEVAFLYDEDALYVGARMYSSSPDLISAVVTRRDNSGISERLIISLDTYRDRRTASSFSISAAGGRTDYYHPSDYEFDRDYSFDPVWEARTSMTPDGWVAEARIPFSQLRFNDRDIQVWGINMNRYIPTKNEDIYWIPVPKDATGWASRFGELQGIEGVRPSLRMEALPYAATGGKFTGLRDPGNPFDDGRNLYGRVGMDLKMGLGSNFTLDATVNPDFGQVEADPAQVNLSAYETFFDERRPFFVEGSGLLQGNGPDYFYSRRIGASPHGEPYESADYSSVPDNTTILGAAKVTGRTESGLSLGGLMAVTAREYARMHSTLEGHADEVMVEPATGYGVLRVEQEIGEEGSAIGATLTAVGRDMPTVGDLPFRLVHQAVTGGVDWNYRFADGEYELDGYHGGSYVHGTKPAISSLQRSSARYYQRPDADHVTFDPDRTSLAGYTSSLQFERLSGTHWRWGAGLLAESPGFELNDLGSFTSADDLEYWGNLRYRETVPGDLFHSYEMGIYHGTGWNFGGVLRFIYLTASFNATWRNYWNTALEFSVNDRGYSDDLTRGGPLMETARTWNATITTANNYAASNRWDVGASIGGSEIGGWNYTLGTSLSSDISDQVSIFIAPAYNRSVGMRQYVMTANGGRPETYNRRYVFAAIDQDQVSARIRASYAITPDLSLELYAEPFAASGHYYRFGELERPRSRFLRVYGTDGTTFGRLPNGNYITFEREDLSHVEIPDPDFNIISFRSNLVLRWEWRPGSSLYLVWQQDRFGADGRGDHVRPAYLWDAATATGDNFLTLKATYWLGIN